jgi:hypothetical protein
MSQNRELQVSPSLVVLRSLECVGVTHTSVIRASIGIMLKCSRSGVYKSSEATFRRYVFQLAGMDRRNSTSVSLGIDSDVMKFLQVMCLRLKISHSATSSLW